MASAQDNNPSSSATPLRYPGIRPETRSKVIEILAGNANGCLQELGYTPQMLDRMQFLQQQNEVWKQENVKLFQDNTKLMYDNKALTEHNAKLLVTNKELHIHLDALYSANRTYEQFREKEGSNILKEYANLQWHYKAAVEQLKQLAASQPPASGSKQLNANTQHTPTISAQPQRRASAGVPQVHSPLGSQQPYAYQQQQPLSPNVAQTWRNETVPAIVQQRPHPVSQQHASQYVASHPVPRVPHWPSHTPEQSHLPNTYSSVGPVPLNAPVVAVALSHYTNQGNITPQLPPTPPMSALPLALQNFASPATLRSVPSSSSHRVPPRTASSTSSSFHRTPVFAHSPPLPPAATSQSAPRPSPPTAPHASPPLTPQSRKSLSPPEAQEAITPPQSAPDAAEVRVASLPPESLKRRSASPEAGPDGAEEAHKKPRLEDDANPIVKMEADEDQKPVIANQDDDDDDDLEDHLIEIGPDGLRTVSDCVAAVFDPDEENPCALICAFCVHRHTTQGGESPDRFIGATIEGLAAHCMEEHETAWGLLRANVEE